MPLTTGQIASHCHVSHVTALKWIKEGRLKAYTPPCGHHRIEKLDLYNFLVQHEMPTRNLMPVDARILMPRDTSSPIGKTARALMQRVSRDNLRHRRIT